MNTWDIIDRFIKILLIHSSNEINEWFCISSTKKKIKRIHCVSFIIIRKDGDGGGGGGASTGNLPTIIIIIINIDDVIKRGKKQLRNNF